MIGNHDRQEILKVLQSPQWPTIERFANELCDRIAYDSTVRESQWDTVRDTLLNEGQIRGIKRLFKNLYEEARNDNA